MRLHKSRPAWRFRCRARRLLKAGLGRHSFCLGCGCGLRLGLGGGLSGRGRDSLSRRLGRQCCGLRCRFRGLRRGSWLGGGRGHGRHMLRSRRFDLGGHSGGLGAWRRRRLLGRSWGSCWLRNGFGGGLGRGLRYRFGGRLGRCLGRGFGGGLRLDRRCSLGRWLARRLRYRLRAWLCRWLGRRFGHWLIHRFRRRLLVGLRGRLCRGGGFLRSRLCGRFRLAGGFLGRGSGRLGVAFGRRLGHWLTCHENGTPNAEPGSARSG